VIRKDAAASDIAADAKATLANAAARGGVWKDLADEKLGPAGLLLLKVIEDGAKVNEALMPLEAALDMQDDETDDFLGAKADEMWNLIGRPASDAAYSLIWPGGVATYADGRDEEQPDRMDLLADLLEAGLHPKLDAGWTKATAEEVRKRAAAYRAKVDALRPVRAKAALLGKTTTVLARSVQMELARLKRRYLAEGLTEAEIHKVIPDRPRAKPAGPAKKQPATPEAAKPEANKTAPSEPT
jgi:hypothetical protein